MRKMITAFSAAAAFGLVAASSALAGGPANPDAFVCPVLTISEQAAIHTDGHFNSIGNGEYTFGPGAAGSADTFNGNVPDHATNGDGTGSPGGAHSSPGDTDYTAIWSGH